MPTVRSRRELLFVTLGAALMVPLAGCGKGEGEGANAAAPPFEGRYKNAKGAVVLEIKEGQVLFTNPADRSKTETSYSESGDNKLMVESSAGVFTLTFAPPDTITGLPPAIAGDAGPLTKVQ